MESVKFNALTLLSIFKRKGGEGVFTKIVNDENRRDYAEQQALLDEDESALLVYKDDKLNWWLFTNKRIVEGGLGVKFEIFFSNLKDVNVAIQEEFNDKIVQKEKFTRLLLKDEKENAFILKLERGKPFQGIYQMLHYISSNNKNR